MSSRKSIGRYEIRRLLGQGGMGTVYLAWDPQMDREIALKTIRTDGPMGDDTVGARARFLKEARLAGRLLHPHIATVFDVGEADGVLFLAMEFVDGTNLSERLGRTSAPLPIRETLVIAAQVAEALAHAHSRGVVHRDIKPANILFTQEDVAKVTDFGIGKLIGADVTTMTATGQMVGSPSYMSPEQIRSEPLDGRSDLFSLGLVIYECLTHRKPFAGDSLTGLIYQILTTEPPDLPTLRPEVPAEVAALVKRAIAKNPTDRFANASEMAAELRKLAASVPESGRAGAITAVNTEKTVLMATTEVTAPVSRTTPPPPTKITTPVPVMAPAPPESRSLAPLLVGGGVLLILAVAAAGFFFMRKGEGPGGASQQPTPSPAPSVVAAAPTRPALSASPSPAVTETPGPVRIVELTPPIPPTAPSVATPKAIASQTAEGIAAARPSATPTSPPGEPPALRLSTRRLVKVGVSPEEASVFVDGRYVGTADDWDGHRGGALLGFTSPGRHLVRLSYPGKEDLTVEVVVTPAADDDEVEIDQKLRPGTPKGPLGPQGKFKSPSYKTRGPLLFKVEPPAATVSVDGRLAGKAEDFVSSPLRLDSMKVYEITLASPGYESKSFRVVCSPSVDDEKVVVKEKLKSQR